MLLQDIDIQCHLYSHGAGADLHALGAEELLILNDPIGAWDEAQRFLDAQKGRSIFASFAYELKNDLEALSSDNEVFIPYPSLVLFVPKVLLTYEIGELEVIEINDRTFDLKDIKPQLAALHQDAQIHSAPKEIRSLSKEDYLEMVRSIKQHIQLGDIYEANICQEFRLEDISLDPWKTFSALASQTQAPYSCHLRIKDKHLLCASPELFLEKEGLTIRSKPIKGTRPRAADPVEDKRLKEELALDLKERGENIMICDLVRNDLSRTAVSGSVRVTELCEVYSYDTVHQMISTIESEISEDMDALEVIKQAFPMGSMTGAPKIRAMELIEEHEDFKRGIYSGAVGYFTPSRDFTFNVVIRSILYDDVEKRASVGAGGAITALSEPDAEYEESLLKAKAMMAVLGIEV